MMLTKIPVLSRDWFWMGTDFISGQFSDDYFHAIVNLLSVKVCNSGDSYHENQVIRTPWIFLFFLQLRFYPPKDIIKIFLSSLMQYHKK